MKKTRESARSKEKFTPESPEDEPIGIVISRGSGGEVRSVFSAYIWGPAPETSAEPASRVA